MFAAWLETSRINSNDAILIFSVGDGDVERKLIPNLVKAIDAAKKHSAKVFGVVGKDTGRTAKQGDIVVVIPQENPAPLHARLHPSASGRLDNSISRTPSTHAACMDAERIPVLPPVHLLAQGART